jgi:hypothetical protein
VDARSKRVILIKPKPWIAPTKGRLSKQIKITGSDAHVAGVLNNESPSAWHSYSGEVFSISATADEWWIGGRRRWSGKPNSTSVSVAAAYASSFGRIEASRLLGKRHAHQVLPRQDRGFSPYLHLQVARSRTGILTSSGVPKDILGEGAEYNAKLIPAHQDAIDGLCVQQVAATWGIVNPKRHVERAIARLFIWCE